MSCEINYALHFACELEDWNQNTVGNSVLAEHSVEFESSLSSCVGYLLQQTEYGLFVLALVALALLEEHNYVHIAASLEALSNERSVKLRDCQLRSKDKYKVAHQESVWLGLEHESQVEVLQLVALLLQKLVH